MHALIGKSNIGKGIAMKTEINTDKETVPDGGIHGHVYTWIWTWTEVNSKTHTAIGQVYR